jgi:hypothetical protein
MYNLNEMPCRAENFKLFFKNFDLESEYSATQRTGLDIETLRENIKTKKEEKRKLTEKYELALKKINIMEEELKNERLICKENYEKQINEISKQIEVEDLQLKKVEQKKLIDETIIKKRQERENKEDDNFQRQKGVERLTFGKQIGYENIKIKTQIDANISEQSNKLKTEREKFFSNSCGNKNNENFKFNKNLQENNFHISDRRDSSLKKIDAEIVGHECGIEAFMSEDDEDYQMEVDPETTPVSNLSNTFQASASEMKQQFEERSAPINKKGSEIMTNLVKKENTRESSFYYNRRNSLQKPETVDNSNVKSIKADNTNNKYRPALCSHCQQKVIVS